MKSESEFYIGWQASAPPSIARVVRRFVIGLCVVVPVFVAAIVIFQKGFSNGNFEYGKSSELSGIFTRKPFPFISVVNGKNPSGNPVVQKILLVGAGKFGFTIDSGIVKDGAMVNVSGFMIYNDGKTAMEVQNMVPVNKKSIPDRATLTADRGSAITMSAITLQGEITDPKCLLGVMNPGQGKPHRDCAIRCISGGLPPLLKVANADGATEYYLLADQEGNSINSRIINFVGDVVAVCGRLEQQSDWWVLYTDPKTIKRIANAPTNPESVCH